MISGRVVIITCVVVIAFVVVVIVIVVIAAVLFSLQLPLAAVVSQGNQKTLKRDTLPPCLWHPHHQHHITTATSSSVSA